MVCNLIIASSHHILFHTIPCIFLFLVCSARYWELCHRDVMSAAPISRIHGQIEAELCIGASGVSY